MSTPTPTTGKNLAVTALYTAQTWEWAGFDAADLLTGPRTRAAFRWTNVLHNLARRFRPDAPVLSSSLAQRHQCIDALVEQAGNPVVLEIAAGLSPRGVSMSADPALSYIEVDLPVVADFKRKRLGQSEAGAAALRRDNYTLLGGDVRTLDLHELVGERAVTVVIEGLFMYFEPEEQRVLWARLHDLVAAHPSSLLIFDLTPKSEEPPPGWLGRLLGGLMRLSTRGRGFADAPRTRTSIEADLAQAGFTSVHTHEPNNPPSGLSLLHSKDLTQFLAWVCRSNPHC